MSTIPKKIILILLGLVLVSGVYAEDKKQLPEQASEKAEFILERVFDESVLNVIYGEAELTVKEAKALKVKGLGKRKDNEKVKVKYPKVLMIRDEKDKRKQPRRIKSLKFLDRKGNIKKEMLLQRYIPGKQRPANVILSKNKRYIAITSVKKEIYGDVLESETEILDNEGDILWKVSYHISSARVVSPNGKYIVSYGMDDMIRIFYKNEKEIIIMSMRPSFATSEDGKLFALNSITGRRNKQTKERIREANLIVFDDGGNELWRKEKIAAGKDVSWTGIEIDGNDNIIFKFQEPLGGRKGGVRTKKALYFDKKGNLLKTINEEK